MNRTMPISQLRELVTYDPDTGVIRFLERKPSLFVSKTGRDREWLASNWNTRYAGQEASSINRLGYRIVGLFGQSFLAHRIAWALTYGEWPKNHIDHINGNPLDNRIANLRDATHQQNHSNRKLAVTNQSGHYGVVWTPKLGKWRSQIKVHQRRIHLGYFTKYEDAVAARKAAEAAHGFHQNHGRAA